MHLVLKALHVLGAVLFLGNMIVTALWKASADRTGDPRVARHAQRQVFVTDLVFTGGGAVLLLATGLHLAMTLAPHFWKIRWIMEGLGLFLISGVIWGAVLVPVQARQRRLLADADPDGGLPDGYLRLGRIWLRAGLAATLPVVWALWVMVAKPN